MVGNSVCVINICIGEVFVCSISTLLLCFVYFDMVILRLEGILDRDRRISAFYGN